VAQEGLEVLHFHYAVPFAFLAAEVKRRLGEAAPVLMGTLHGTDVSAFGQNPLKGTRLAQALMVLDHLTTVSISNARLAKAIFRLPALSQVIPNFVDLSRFRPPNSQLEPENASPEGCGVLSRPKIVHVSNFRKVKTLPSVARIFLGIRQRLEAEFWVVGDGEMRDELVSLFRGSEFKKDVRFFGLRADVAPILAQTQLLLMHSQSESFCLAALEAMACGVPVLASRVGGLPEVVTHGQTGFLVPFGDHQTAVDLAVALLSDPAGHRAMREAALRRARRFGRDRIVSSYENLYQRLLSSQGTAFKSACGQGIGRLGRT
jgi:N-acetyl-alpha-D-glucosaminyl L-malate synthase BshA